MFSQNFWLLDMTHQYLAGAIKTRVGSLGASIYYSSSGDIPKIEEFVLVGEYDAYDAALSVAYANSYRRILSYGVSVKYILEKIEEERASTVAADLGILYEDRRFPGLKAGVILQNIGPGIKFIEREDKLPFAVKVASSYARDDYLVAVEIVGQVDADLALAAGGEYVVAKVLALRAGYNTARSISLGFGVDWRKLGLSYAFAPNKDLDASHRITAQVEL
jgi:hypothetical protein